MRTEDMVPPNICFANTCLFDTASRTSIKSSHMNIKHRCFALPKTPIEGSFLAFYTDKFVGLLAASCRLAAC